MFELPLQPSTRRAGLPNDREQVDRYLVSWVLLEKRAYAQDEFLTLAEQEDEPAFFDLVRVIAKMQCGLEVACRRFNDKDGGVLR